MTEDDYDDYVSTTDWLNELAEDYEFDAGDVDMPDRMTDVERDAFCESL